MTHHKNLFDVIAIGDSALDVFLHIHEATVSCQLHTSQCLLCLEYANKIPVESVTKVAGAGNASNAAIGAARLGLRAAIVSVLGEDETGEQILASWEKEGVGLDYIVGDKKHETNYSTVLNFKGERTILTYSQPRTYVLPPLDEASWIYYTSLGAKHEKLEGRMMDYLNEHPETKLAFNPGTSQLHRGLEALKPVIARSELFVINKEEGQRLLEDGDRPMTNMLLSFTHLGAKHVVITDGPNGSYATDGTSTLYCPIFPGPIVERTGAGDSFATGVLFGLFHHHSLAECMRIGTANAWSVVQKIGPQAGLLNQKSMQAALKKFAKIKPSPHNHVI